MKNWINVKARMACPGCDQWIDSPKEDGTCPLCGHNILHLENGPGMEGVTAIDKKQDSLKKYIGMIYGDGKLDEAAIMRIKRQGEGIGLTPDQAQDVINDIQGGR